MATSPLLAEAPDRSTEKTIFYPQGSYLRLKAEENWERPRGQTTKKHEPEFKGHLDQLRRLDVLQRDLDQKYNRAGGNIGRQRTLARLRLKANRAWQPDSNMFKLDMEGASIGKLQEAYLPGGTGPGTTRRYHFGDTDALERYLHDMERQREEEYENRRHAARAERTGRLVKRQENLLSNLHSMSRNMRQTDSYTTMVHAL